MHPKRRTLRFPDCLGFVAATCLLMTVCTGVWASDEPVSDPDYFVVIGQLESLDRLEDPCPIITGRLTVRVPEHYVDLDDYLSNEPEEYVRDLTAEDISANSGIYDDEVRTVCIRMNQYFRTEYRVLEVIKGDFSETELVFIDLDHYGVPYYARAQHAMLFFERRPGEHRYSLRDSHPVYKSHAGEWASCLDTYFRTDDKKIYHLESIKFEGSFKDVPFVSEAGLNYTLGSGFSIREDGTIHCKEAVRETSLLNGTLENFRLEDKNSD